MKRKTGKHQYRFEKWKGSRSVVRENKNNQQRVSRTVGMRIRGLLIEVSPLPPFLLPRPQDNPATYGMLSLSYREALGKCVWFKEGPVRPTGRGPSCCSLLTLFTTPTPAAAIWASIPALVAAIRLLASLSFIILTTSFPEGSFFDSGGYSTKLNLTAVRGAIRRRVWGNGLGF